MSAESGYVCKKCGYEWDASPPAWILAMRTERNAMSDIWKDPRVKNALKEGRTPNDIWVMDCPICHQPGYYQHGWLFACLACKETFYCRSEGEDPPSGPHVYVGDARKLSDCL